MANAINSYHRWWLRNQTSVACRSTKNKRQQSVDICSLQVPSIASDRRPIGGRGAPSRLLVEPWSSLVEKTLAACLAGVDEFALYWLPWKKWMGPRLVYDLSEQHRRLLLRLRGRPKKFYSFAHPITQPDLVNLPFLPSSPPISSHPPPSCVSQTLDFGSSAKSRRPSRL